MRKDSLTRDVALAGLMIAAGVVLHSFPPLLGGMKPDFALVMLILFALLRRDKKITFVAGLATGVITALTTGFPGGQIPNIIDKLVTTAFLLVFTLGPEGNISSVVTALLGTVISGVSFLGSAFLIVGLPAPFMALFNTVVLPAALVNTILIAVLYPVAKKLTGIIQSKMPVKEKKV